MASGTIKRSTKSLSIDGDKRQITDGPFAETAEQLGGYYIIDIEHLDAAIAIASRIPAEHKVAISESVDLCHRLHAEGKYISAAPLHPPETAKCVSVRDGEVKVSDGPFAETKEQLGGYFLVEARDLDDAIAIATKISGTRRGTAEIRPLCPLPELSP